MSEVVRRKGMKTSMSVCGGRSVKDSQAGNRQPKYESKECP